MKKQMFTVVFLLAIINIGIGFPISCPTDEDLHPCTCKRLAYGLHVECANFNDPAALIKAFKVLRDYKVQNVLMHNVMIPEVLPGDLFDGLEISEIRVESSNLQFPAPAFKGLDDSLYSLNVAENTKIKSSENFSLAQLNKLTELNIKKNPLGVVRNQWLNGKIPNVINVKLDEDDITMIESTAFANLPHLQSISIAENRIKEIERSMFPRPANYLKVIDLSGNEIKSLPYDFFFDMPKLEEVVLSGNELSTLPENIWKAVWEQLNKVFLYDNRIECDSRLDWMKKLRWPRQVEGKCYNLDKKNIYDVYKT